MTYAKRLRVGASSWLLGVPALLVGCAQPGLRTNATGSADTTVGGLYARQCAACHGVAGDGNGPLAPYLFPPPRGFATGLFSLVSTENAMPTDADLVGTIEHGMPGTAMPSFAWLGRDRIRELALHVRKLAVEGCVNDVAAIAAHDALPIDRAAVRARAVADLTPGRVFDVHPEIAGSPEVLERGRRAYTVACAACHGEDGRGQRLSPELRQRFDLRLPRDFTTGILRGGVSAAAIQHRIEAGMPASSMPPTRLAPRQMQELVAYVRSLLPEASKQREAVHVAKVVAARVSRIPDDPADGAWRSNAVGLWPLRATPDAVLDAEVAAVHDGREVAILVRWPDATHDVALASAFLPDAVALQLTDVEEPPFLAMGSARAAVQMWQWQAFSPRETHGILELLDSPLRSKTDAAVGIAPRLVELARSGSTRGRESMHVFADEGKPLSIRPAWRDGRWSVIFRRALAPTDSREIPLRPGGSYRFATAIWNGSAGQRGADKSISSWHTLSVAD